MSNTVPKSRAATVSPPMVARRHRPPHHSLSSKLDLDSAFFWLLLAFLITTFTFLSLRDHHSLDPTQLAEYERRTQYLSNSTVYIVETTRPETLLSKLSADEWARIGREVDIVAIVFDDLPLFLTDDWVAVAEQAMDFDQMQIGLFRCGCLLPSRYFAITDVRMNGDECVVLPGFVMLNTQIKWMHINEGKDCRGREDALSSRGAALRWRKELSDVKRALVKDAATRKKEIDSISAVTAGSAVMRGQGLSKDADKISDLDSASKR